MILNVTIIMLNWRIKTGVKVGYNQVTTFRKPHKQRASEAMTRRSTPLRKMPFQTAWNEKSGIVNSLAFAFGTDYAIIEMKQIFGGVYIWT